MAEYPVSFKVPAWIAAGLILTISLAAVVGLTHIPALLIFLIICGLVLGAASAVRPVFGLFVMLLVMLLSTEVEIGKTESERHVSIGGEDILILVVILGWLVHSALARRGIILKGTPVNLPIFAMGLVIICSTLLGIIMGTIESPSRGFFFASKRLEYFVIFFMVSTLFRGWRDVKIGLILFMAACVAIDLVAILQEVLSPVGGGSVGTFGYGRANTLGGFYVMAISWTLGLLAYVKGGSVRTVLLGIFVLSIISLAFTHSRGAYVAMPFGLLTVMLVDQNRHLLRAAFIGTFFIVLTVLVVWFALGGEQSIFLQREKEKMSSQMGSIAGVFTEGPSSDSSMAARVESWELSIPEIAQYPLLGQGVGSKMLGWADNQFVRELLETGMVGFMVFIWMNLTIFMVVIHMHRNSEGLVRGAAAGFAGGHVGLLVHAMTCSNFYTIRTMEPFWFMLGMLMAMWIAKVKEETEKEKQEKELKAREIEEAAV